MTPTEVAVVGAGSMGRLHCKTVAAHPRARLVEVVDPDRGRAAGLAAEFGAPVVSTDGPTSDAQLVIVATPTRTHVRVAQPLLDRWVLVEKPLAGSVADAAALVHPRCLVGHSERFHPALRNLTRTPHHVEVLREAPWTARGRDIDVVFDLMLHDLDLVRRWAAGEVDVDDAGGRSGTDGLDVAWASIVWAGGHARLDASRVAARRWRRAYLDGQVLDLLAPVEGKDALTAQLDAVLHHLGVGSGATTSADALETLRLAELVRERCTRRAMDSMDEAPSGWGTW